MKLAGVGEQTLNGVLVWCRCETNIGLVSELLAAGCARASSQLNFREEEVPKPGESAISSVSAEQDSSRSASDEQVHIFAEPVAGLKICERSRTSADIEVTQAKLLGKTVVVTGSFGPWDREYMYELVRSHGGKVRTSVSITLFLFS